MNELANLGGLERRYALNPSQGFQTIHDRHLNIHQDKIWVMLQTYCCRAVQGMLQSRSGLNITGEHRQ
jgi:hypothetical protein